MCPFLKIVGWSDISRTPFWDVTLPNKQIQINKETMQNSDKKKKMSSYNAVYNVARMFLNFSKLRGCLKYYFITNCISSVYLEETGIQQML